MTEVPTTTDVDDALKPRPHPAMLVQLNVYVLPDTDTDVDGLELNAVPPQYRYNTSVLVLEYVYTRLARLLTTEPGRTPIAK